MSRFTKFVVFIDDIRCCHLNPNDFPPLDYYVNWSNKNNLKKIINVIDEQKNEEIKKLRDRSIILVGFGGGFRRTELISIDHEDLEFVPEGLKITIRRSKTDQFGEGMIKGLPYFTNQIYCPVLHLKKWLELSNIKSSNLDKTSGSLCLFLNSSLPLSSPAWTTGSWSCESIEGIKLLSASLAAR